MEKVITSSSKEVASTGDVIHGLCIGVLLVVCLSLLYFICWPFVREAVSKAVADAKTKTHVAVRP